MYFTYTCFFGGKNRSLEQRQLALMILLDRMQLIEIQQELDLATLVV